MSSVRFTQPPVREVSLTVLWEPVGKLLAADVGDLLSELRPSYPTISERPAMPPWSDIRFPSIKVLAFNEVLPYSWWLADAGDNRMIRFQFDRIIFSWRHAPSGSPYPGYNAMRTELSRVIEVTSHWLEAKRPSVESLATLARRVQIDYINQLDVAPIELLRGIATSWQENVRTPIQPVSSLLAATLLIENDAQNETTIKVEPDGSRGSTLTLISAIDRDPTEDDDYLTSLDRAHSRARETFLEITSEQLQQKWGRVDGGGS